MSIIRNVSFMALPLVLVACGGEEQGAPTESTPEQGASLSLKDASLAYPPSVERHEVNLSHYVTTSDNSPFKLTRVEALSSDADCQVLGQTDTQFYVAGDTKKVCDYRYFAESVSGKSMVSQSLSNTSNSALVRLATTETSADAELPPLNNVTLKNTPVSVDLHAHFDAIGLDVSEWVLSEAVTLPYNHDALVDVDVANQTLTYTPENDFTGIDRILFSFTDDEQNPRMGQVDIAISVEANQGLEVHENIVYPTEVNANNQVEIDISPYVTSPDGDDYQLVYLQAFNAQLSPVESDVMYNKKFYFESAKAGDNIVTFAVSDHKGAYDVGMMQISVLDESQSAQWLDIRYGLNRFTAPITAYDAEGAGVVYDSSYLDTGYTPAIKMALFRYHLAAKYCESIGAEVPSSTQLSNLAKNINVKERYNWPTQAVSGKYYAQENGAPYSVDILSGISSSVPGDVAYQVTCVVSGALEVVLPDSKLQAVANASDKAEIAVQLTKEGGIAEGEAVSASLSQGSSAQLDADTVITDENGMAVFKLRSIKAESLTLTAEFGGETTEAEVKFIGDINTAMLSMSTTLNNQYHAQANEVTAVLHDAFDNPLVGYNVSFSADTDSVDVTQGLTDADGKLVSKITWTDVVPTDVYSKASIIAEFDEGPEPSTQSSDVTFITIPMCGTGVNDSNPNNAVGTCLKVKEALLDGKKIWLTSSPSKNVMDTLGYTQDSSPNNFGKTYDSFRNETGVYGPVGQFAQFQYNNIDTGQLSRFCEDLNKMHFGGKNDWI
ncbi:hypothetical protein DLH97_25420, partial [Vibrio parahaemolyticus]|nr:hypothetical protein [Vibrio parahaemolyticus]